LSVFPGKHFGEAIFYLPHMEYEGSIGFVMRKMKIFIADFHVLGLFMAKKHDLPLPFAKFTLHLQARP
jgi:hypothetical protein